MKYPEVYIKTLEVYENAFGHSVGETLKGWWYLLSR